MITGCNDQMGCITNIAAGIVGAIVGGWLFSFFGGGEVTGSKLVEPADGSRWGCGGAGDSQPHLWQEEHLVLHH